MSILRSSDAISDLRRFNSNERPFLIAGNNPDIDTVTFPEDLWPGGGVYTGFDAPTAQPLSIDDPSGNDNSAGTGLRSAFIEGLDAAGNYTSELWVLDGTDTVNSYHRLNMFTGVGAGANALMGGNEGILTITQATSGIVMDVIAAGKGRTTRCCYSVPLGREVEFMGVFGSLNDQTNDVIATLELTIFPFGECALRPVTFSVNSSAGGLHFPVMERFSVPPRADFTMRVIDVESSNADVTFGIQAKEIIL